LLFPGEALPEISRLNPVAASSMRLRALATAQAGGVFSENKRLRLVNEFDSSFDVLSREAAERWVVRESFATRALLSWQYQLQPGKKFDVLGFYEEDRLLGLCGSFFRPPRFIGLAESRHYRFVLSSVEAGLRRLTNCCAARCSSHSNARPEQFERCARFDEYLKAFKFFGFWR
jgi:hypothetical protein